MKKYLFLLLALVAALAGCATSGVVQTGRLSDGTVFVHVEGLPVSDTEGLLEAAQRGQYIEQVQAIAAQRGDPTMVEMPGLRGSTGFGQIGYGSYGLSGATLQAVQFNADIMTGQSLRQDVRELQDGLRRTNGAIVKLVRK